MGIEEELDLVGVLGSGEAGGRRANHAAEVGAVQAELGVDLVEVLLEPIPGDVRAVAAGGNGRDDVDGILRLHLVAEGGPIQGLLLERLRFDVAQPADPIKLLHELKHI